MNSASTAPALYLRAERVRCQQARSSRSDRLGLGRCAIGLIDTLYRRTTCPSRFSTSPFVFSTVNERPILRFLKLIACDNAKIGTYAKLVDDRNDAAHSNGNIFFSTPEALETKITEILRVVDEIQTHSKPVIEEAYREFLLQSHDLDGREYSDDVDQIREILVHHHYLSRKDIEICLAYDLEPLKSAPNFTAIEALHRGLDAEYALDI